jgi:hypothetical protein
LEDAAPRGIETAGASAQHHEANTGWTAKANAVSARILSEALPLVLLARIGRQSEPFLSWRPFGSFADAHSVAVPQIAVHFKFSSVESENLLRKIRRGGHFSLFPCSFERDL